jgi:hypothetical protein
MSEFLEYLFSLSKPEKIKIFGIVSVESCLIYNHNVQSRNALIRSFSASSDTRVNIQQHPSPQMPFPK